MLADLVPGQVLDLNGLRVAQVLAEVEGGAHDEATGRHGKSRSTPAKRFPRLEVSACLPDLGDGADGAHGPRVVVVEEADDLKVARQGRVVAQQLDAAAHVLLGVTEAAEPALEVRL